MVTTITADLIYLTQVTCGEGPTWDEVTQKLYWVDIDQCHVYIFNPANRSNTGYHVGQLVGALSLREKGGLLLALSKGFYFFDPETGKSKPLIDPEEEFPDHHFNDGKCDPMGRFWAGTYHQDAEKSVGKLYSLDLNLNVVERHQNLILSNGLAWSLDHSKFYLIDSVPQAIYVFDYDVHSGEISNRILLRKIENSGELPDGMTIDTEGFLWVAIFNGGKIIRINPKTGKTVFEVIVPNAKQVTSCTFGGINFDELYITTAKGIGGRFGMLPSELPAQQNSGGLFRAKVPFKGIPAVRFKG